MPNIKSAKKRMRQNEKRRTHNKGIKSAAKTEMKKFLTYIEEGKVEEAKTSLPTTISTLDKAAKNRVFHKNYVSRQKSSLYGKLNKLQASS